MKKSRTLKAISYIIMPILIVALGLSVFSIILEDNSYYDKEKYFNSEDFVYEYITNLANNTYHLIHNTNMYNTLQDGETEIHYSINEIKSYNEAKNNYYLIIYKNKALTNVELTSQTNSIEKIKQYIQKNENAKQVNIINGNINSESEIIQNIGIKYLNSFNRTYYTLETNTETNKEYREYKTATIKDIQIYSSYVEEFAENSRFAIMNEIVEKFEPIKEYSYFIIPASSTLLLLIIVYLIISIGYKKGVDGIDINDFDKIPLEILLIIAIGIGCIAIVPVFEISEDYNAIMSFIITGGLIIYILCVILLNTTVKRIKSKTLVKTTIIGKIAMLIEKCFKKVYNQLKKYWNTLFYSTNITMRIFIYCIKILTIELIAFAIFKDSFITFLVTIILIGAVIYKVVRTLKEFSQIESKLKEMYNGNNSGELKKSEFMLEFQKAVEYLNNISNGFENAIQDRMKSERMKAELITNVSHDIKTPLTSIINYVDLLKQENIENDKAKEYIEILDNKSQRLKKLTEDLIEASKVSTGNISLKLEKINIVELIKQASGEFEDKFKEKGLQVISDNNINEINIMADSRYMYRVIENLFSNISKYALENSRVYIDIKIFNKNVIIEIKNVSKDRLNISAEELMQRFVRGDKSRTTEGSGLGISIAQNLTELQNGEFNLKLDGDLFKVQLEFEIIEDDKKQN